MDNQYSTLHGSVVHNIVGGATHGFGQRVSIGHVFEVNVGIVEEVIKRHSLGRFPLQQLLQQPLTGITDLGQAGDLTIKRKQYHGILKQKSYMISMCAAHLQPTQGQSWHPGCLVSKPAV